MRFRPANIRVINRRDSYCAVIGSAVQTRNAQSPPTGTCSRYAARRRLLEMPATYATGGFHEMARRVNPFRAAPFAFFPGFLGIGSETVKAAPKARSYQP